MSCAINLSPSVLVPSDVGKPMGTLLNWFLVTYPEYQNKFVKLWSYEAWPKPRDDIVDVDEGIDIIALDTEGKILSPFPATQRRRGQTNR